MSPFPYDRRLGRFANLRCNTIWPLNWVLLSVAPEFLCRPKGCLGVTWHLYLRYRHGEFTRGSPDRYLKIRSFRGPGWRCARRPASEAAFCCVSSCGDGTTSHRSRFVTPEPSHRRRVDHTGSICSAHTGISTQQNFARPNSGVTLASPAAEIQRKVASKRLSASSMQERGRDRDEKEERKERREKREPPLPKHS